MIVDKNTLILHQYDISPYSEKIRIAFGLKGVAWSACRQPVVKNTAAATTALRNGLEDTKFAP